MNNKGVDPNLMALIQNASRNQDAWGGGMWWIWVIIMFWLWGGNGNMFGRNYGIDGIPNQLNNDFENSDDLNLCIKKMKSLIRKYYHKYFRLLDDKDSSIAFDLLHPYLNSLKNKILGNK